jgi:hypothetical protein
MHYVFRIATPLFAVAWIALAINWTIRPEDALAPFFELFSFPAGFFCVGTLFNTLVFPWPFNAFGPRRRTPRPSGAPTAVRWARFTTFGARCSLGMVKWSFFGNGVDIATFVGRVWMPRECVARIEYGKRRLAITHSSHEVRSPIIAPSSLSELVDWSLGPANQTTCQP